MSRPTVKDYYDTIESRIGYRLMLGGTRHFGYYEKDTWWPFPLTAALRAMEEQLFQILQLPAGARVLDAGAGAGHVAIYMAEKGLKVEAIDLLERHVEKARANVAARQLQNMVHVTRQSYQDLSFEDSLFDGAYTMETLSHATDPERALQELYRVLKPGGTITLFEYEHNIQERGAAMSALSQVNTYSSMTAFQGFTIGTIRKTMEAVGFEDIEVHDLTQNVIPMMRFFFIIAYLPYLIIKLLGLERHFVNTMAAVEFYRYGHRITYNGFRARRKPF